MPDFQGKILCIYLLYRINKQFYLLHFSSNCVHNVWITINVVNCGSRKI